MGHYVYSRVWNNSGDPCSCEGTISEPEHVFSYVFLLLSCVPVNSNAYIKGCCRRLYVNTVCTRYVPCLHTGDKKNTHNKINYGPISVGWYEVLP